jgi:hypothetical protein
MDCLNGQRVIAKRRVILIPAVAGEGSLTGFFCRAIYEAFAEHPVRDPSPSMRLGMTVL